MRLTVAGGYSQRGIAAVANCSAGTVSNVQRRMRSSGIDDDAALPMSEGELHGLPGGSRGRAPNQDHAQPDFAAIDEQLPRHNGLTLMVLWEEYARRRADAGREAYMYSFFAQKYREWRSASDLSLRIAHVPGGKMEVDWAGAAMGYVDCFTGEILTVHIFVAALPYSQYTFAKPAESMGSDSWVACNIAALRFFGGAPRIIVPGNLKTGTDAHASDEVRVDRAFQEFGDHCSTAIIPTGARKPKHKASVEGNVGKIGERMALMLRNTRFFSLEDIERAILEKLSELNARPFERRKDGSRTEAFPTREKRMLAPLPAAGFESGRRTRRSVSPDYRVSAGASACTVPYAFADQAVDVRIGRDVTEVFCDGERIAAHARSKEKGGDVKRKSHRPKWRTDLLEQPGERFGQRAEEEIGPWGHEAAEAMLSAGKVEEEGRRPCAKLLNLVSSYGQDAVGTACERACGIARYPSLKTIETPLKNQPGKDEQKQALEDYAILRDEDYCTRNANRTGADETEGEL